MPTVSSRHAFGRHGAAAFVEEVARLAVAIDAHGEMGRIVADLFGQRIARGAAGRTSQATSEVNFVRHSVKRRTGRIEHEPQRTQGVIVRGESGQIRFLDLKSPQRPEGARGPVAARFVARSRASIAGPAETGHGAGGEELQSHASRLDARVAHEQSARAPR